MAKGKKPPKEEELITTSIDGFSFIEDSRGKAFRDSLKAEINRLRSIGCIVLRIDAKAPCFTYDRWTAFIYYSQPIT